MVDHHERTVAVRDGAFQIKVLEGGDGEPLVYIHGEGGLRGWEPHLDRLAQEFRVFAPYHPGVGASAGLEHLDELWDLVLFYEELLDALGIRTTLLMGHSYGGMVAAELAAHCPQRIQRLALVASMGLWLDDSPVADYFAMSAEARAKAVWHDPSSQVAQAALSQSEDPTERIEASLDVTKTLAAVGKFSWPIPERGLKKRIHRITAPTLLVWGADDGIVPNAYAAEFHRLIPSSRLLVLEGCGHIPQEERPDGFFSSLIPFLKEA